MSTLLRDPVAASRTGGCVARVTRSIDVEPVLWRSVISWRTRGDDKEHAMPVPAARTRSRHLKLPVLWTVLAAHSADAGGDTSRNPAATPAPVQMTAQQGHRRMMELLGITELRRGADGMNRQSPNYQNTDEAK